MKKTFLSLFLIALIGCFAPTAWADEVHELFVDGEINSDYFYTTGTATDCSFTIDDVTYTKYVLFTSTTKTIAGVNNPNRIIQYDARTTETQVEFVVVNTSTSNNRNVYYTVIENGATTCVPETLAIAKGGTNYVSEMRTTTSTKNRSIYFSVDNYSDVKIAAIRITEKGTALPMVGEAGYSLSFANSRLIAQSNALAKLDGMEMVLRSNYSALTNTNPHIELNSSTQYMKFYVPQAVKLTITYADAQVDGDKCPLYVSQTSDGTDNETIGLKNTSFTYTLTGGSDWYIHPKSGKTSRIASIEFAALGMTVDAPTNVTITSEGILTFDEEEGCTYKLQVFDGETLIKEQQNVTSGSTITRPLLKAGNFPIKLFAIKQGTPSDPTSATWTLADASVPAENMPYSEYCGYQIGSGNGVIGMTWETDGDGNINISTVGIGAQWRSDALQGIGKFTVANGIPASAYFDIEYAGAGSTVYTLKLKPGASVARGEQISYNGTAQWQINGSGNYYKAYTWTYTYGAVCEVLELTAPTDLAVNNNVLTFTGNELAESYTAMIYYNGILIDHYAVEPSGTTLTRPMLTGATYQVAVVANGAGGQTSDESVRADWTLTGTPASVPESPYCSYEIGNGNTLAMMTWQTDAEGNIVIRITGDNHPTWRNDAFGNNASSFTVGTITATVFFDVEYTNGAEIYTLKKKNGVTLVDGEPITYRGSLQWKNDLDNNAYTLNQVLPFTYGSACPVAGLSAPTNLSIDANDILTFTGDENADTYTADIYYGDIVEPVASHTIQSGSTLTRPTLTGATYRVVVTAHTNTGEDSDASDPYTWVLTDSPIAAENMPESEYCSYNIGSGNALAMMTWQTNEEGNIVIRITGDNNPTWRGNDPFGTVAANFKVGPLPASMYFETEYTTGAVVYTLRKKQDVTVAAGETITYNGPLAWKNDLENNAYMLNQTLTYTYGSSCPVAGLTTPTNLAVNASNVLTFTGDENADTYTADIYYGDIVDPIASYSVQPGSTLTRPTLTGATYRIVVTAHTNTGEDSEASEPYNWVLANSPVAEEDMPASEYCAEPLGTGESAIGMSWNTDENGNINITTVGIGAQWRATAFHGVQYFKVGVLPASDFFEEEYAGDGSTVYTLRLKEGVTVARGEQITFHESAQWQINGSGNYWETYTFTYTYGSVCPVSGVTAPTGLAINANNVLTFTGNDAATSYTAMIYYGESLIAHYTVQSGSVLTRPMQTGATFQVAVVANGEGGESSDESERINWVLSDVASADIPASEFCSYSIGEGVAMAEMTWKTDRYGNIVITIGGADNPTWRAAAFGGATNFTVGSVPANNFFDEDYTWGATTYTLRLKEGVTLLPGETITYRGSLQWKNDQENNAYALNQVLAYTYGSHCVVDVEVTSAMTQDDIEDYANVTVKDGGVLTIGADKPLSAVIIENGGMVIINSTYTLTASSLIICTTAAAGASGQIDIQGNLVVTGDVFLDWTLGITGDQVAKQWHAFTVPFPVNALNGIYNGSGIKLTNEQDYAIMDYHGDVRATGAYGWKKFHDVLVPGTFYIMTVKGDVTTFRFKMKRGSTIKAANSMAIQAHAKSGAGQDKDAGWNGVGNPTLMYGTVSFDVQVLSPSTYTFVQKDADEVNFTVGTPFFVQAGTNGSIVLTSGNSKPAYAPKRIGNETELSAKVYLTDANFSDRLSIVASESAASTYEAGHDLAKMSMTSTPSVPQISALAYNTDLCKVYTPMTSDEATVDLRLYAPKSGEYTLSVGESTEAGIYLMYNNMPVWNLSEGAYTLDLEKGNTEGYSLRIQRNRHLPTGLDTLQSNDSVQKVIINNQLYILLDGEIFNAVGQKMN